MKEIFPEADVLKLKEPAGGYETSFFIKGGPPVLREWNARRLDNWLLLPHEDFRKTSMGSITLNVDLRSSHEEIHQAVAYGIRQCLRLNPDLRKRSVQWVFKPHGRIRKELAYSLEWLWNGLRSLPYENAVVAEAIAFCIALDRLGFTAAQHWEERLSIVRRFIPQAHEVGFGSWEGSGTKAYVDFDRLSQAIRPDTKKYLLPKYHEHAFNAYFLLQVCTNHRRIFKFDKFANIFAEQIAPIQVLSRRSACHFSPARLSGFGLG